MVKLVGSRARGERAVLTGAERVSLHEMIRLIELETSSEVCVMLVKDSQDPTALAAEYFTRLGIGKRDLDNGVFLLAVLARRQIEILVGAGVKDTLPQSFLERLIGEVLAPRFRGEEFGPGLLLAVEAIGNALRGARPEPPPGEPGRLPDVVDLDGHDRAR